MARSFFANLVFLFVLSFLFSVALLVRVPHVRLHASPLVRGGSLLWFAAPLSSPVRGSGSRWFVVLVRGGRGRGFASPLSSPLSSPVRGSGSWWQGSWVRGSQFASSPLSSRSWVLVFSSCASTCLPCFVGHLLCFVDLFQVLILS